MTQKILELTGLTKNQAIIAETLWTKCKSNRDVEAVIEHVGPEARTVYELLTAAYLDLHDGTDLAKELLDRIAKR